MATASPFNRPRVVISTEVFEGPLDLLLSLIERRKFFINDISLSRVTEEYFQYLQEREVFPSEEASYFILIASTLILIKSRSLLPEVELTEEEEEDADLLEKRLELYKKIKETGAELEGYIGRSPAYHRNFWPACPPVFTPGTELNLGVLRETVYNILQRQQEEVVSIPQAQVKTAIKLEEVAESLRSRISGDLKLSFKEFVGRNTGTGGAKLSREEKIETVVSFLAMLELVHRGLVKVVESDNDIYMEAAPEGSN